MPYGMAVDDEGNVYANGYNGTNYVLTKYDNTGSKIWDYIQPGGNIIARVAEYCMSFNGDQSILYYGVQGGYVFSINTSSGSENWNRYIGTSQVTAVAFDPSDGTLFVGHGTTMYKLDPANGANIVTLGAGTVYCIRFKGGDVYFTANGVRRYTKALGAVWLYNSSSDLYALDFAEGGSRVYAVRSYDNTSNQNISSLLISDGTRERIIQTPDTPTYGLEYIHVDGEENVYLGQRGSANKPLLIYGKQRAQSVTGYTGNYEYTLGRNSSYQHIGFSKGGGLVTRVGYNGNWTIVLEEQHRTIS